MDDIVTIELFGDTYRFKTEAEIENARKVAEYLVNEVEKVEKQLAEKSTAMLRFRLLLLAALNISSDYFKLKSNHKDLLEDLSDRLVSINEKIDNHLQ
ncbi:MAG: cell division protein ZapA [Proteobacteria bacterium]|nr:cell division protein ZapA [Pseudomonadota bacterium]